MRGLVTEAGTVNRILVKAVGARATTNVTSKLAEGFLIVILLFAVHRQLYKGNAIGRNGFTNGNCPAPGLNLGRHGAA